MEKNYLAKPTWFIVLFFFFSFNLFSQVVINEICPSNISVVLNSNGEYDDWIELHNSSGSTLNLNGYGVTDDPLKPYAFKFPSYTLPANGKVLLFATGNTNNIIVNHWEMAVNGTSSWRYAAGSSSIDTNWRNPSFNQSSWSSGNGGIGFADSDDNTTIPVGISVMMRKTFTIPDTSQIVKAVLMMDYDDGFVAYLNGVEIARANLGSPGVRPAWNEVATGSHEANVYQGLPIDSFYISPKVFKSLLVPGTNVLAIETHNNTPTGSDLSSTPYLFFGMANSSTTFSPIPSWFLAPAVDYFSTNFKLSRTGETIYITNPSGSTVDSKTYSAMQPNNSYCRKPDGSSSWCFVSTPTPGASNNSSTCYQGYANAPVFSKAGGYYSSSQTLTLSNSTPGGVIRYTTNGDEPKTTSPQYTSSISLSSSKTIRAKVFASGYLPSLTVTNSYFIGANTKLPTFAISTDSLNLWDYNTGIYVMGPGAAATSPFFGANFWQNWEKPASVEYFDKNKNLIVKFNADLKIYGNYSRAKPQKSFEIQLSDRMGLGSFTYPMYPDKPYVTTVENIVLRNSGTDWNKVHFRDPFMERLLKKTNAGYLAAEPAVAYLNGQYWGVYCISEDHDHQWMKNNFGLGRSEIDYLKEGGGNIYVREGSDVTFWELYNDVTTQNPATQAYYDNVNRKLDLKNYTDYFVAETFYNNGDWIGPWTNNIQLWRPNSPGGKWRYFLYDTDYGMGLKGSVNDDRLEIARNPAAFSFSSEMFDALLNNPTYKRYFINRYCDLMNTIFLYSNMDAVMESFKDSMSYDMPAHFSKWGGNTSTWNTEINNMMDFANDRPDIMKNFIKTQFSLTKKVNLTLKISPNNAGRIEISTITPTTYPWTGDYFDGNPVTITAIPNPGYTFTHWKSSINITSNNPNQTVTYNFTGNDQITAYFTGSAAPVKISVSELNYNSDSAHNAGDWIELHNFGTTSLDLSGWSLSDGNDIHKFAFPTGTVIPANGYLVLAEDTTKFKSQFPTVSKLGPIGFNFSNGGDQVRLFNHLGAVYLTFNYSDLSPWPTTPDGGGYTLELTSDLANPNSSSSWFAGCIGGSPGRAYSGILLSPVAITGSTSFCTGQSVTLTASSGQGYAYQWKRNGTNIQGSTSPSLVVTQSGAYSVYVTSQGCSSESSPTTVSVVSQQQPPQVTAQSRCGPGSISLIASASDTIFWYDSNTNGNLIHIGDTLTQALLNSTTTYYARTGRNCQSTSSPVTATILPQTALPVTSNIFRCGPGPVTLTASNTSQIRWYNQSSNGALLETGPSFVTNILNNDTSFFVEAGTTCPSARVEVFVFVTTAPPVSVHDTSRCGNGTLVLTASSTYPITWYNDQYGGSSIGNGGAFTTPFLALTDTFYAEAVNNGCASVRQPVIANVFNVPSAPLVSDTTVCAPGSYTLNAIATESIRWFTTPSGGNSIFTGSAFLTPVITGSTTYFVENGYNCPSARVPITVNVGTPPAAPASADVARCGTGSVTLIASSPELISWYSSPSGGVPLIASDVYTTPSISVTTTYYAEAGTLCRSLNRTPARAIINPIPAAPSAPNVSNCGPGNIILNASSTETVYWYTTPSGGSPVTSGPTFTTPTISTTTTYYVEAGNTCISNRIPVQAIISQQPAPPTVVNGSVCGSGSASLSASSASNVQWYSTPTGGFPLASGLNFTTPTISTTTTYYAESFNGCSSARVAATATVNVVPPVPTAFDGNRCGTGSVSLTASSNEQIYWYATPNSSSTLFTGSTFNTPSLTATTTYYVETGNVCRSGRIPVQAIINQIPPAPAVTGASACTPSSLTLTANSTSQVDWFTVPSGGVSINTGTTYNTPVLSATTTYYVEASKTGCISTRVPVTAVISNSLAAPVTSGNSRCGTGTVALSATGIGTIQWYSAPSGGSPISSGTSFTTPSISSTTTYYAEASNNGCTSQRIPAVAQVTPQSAAPVTTAGFNCGPGTLTISASSTDPLYWYSVPSGGSSIANGPSYTTPFITSTTTYYVEAGDVCKSPRVAVLAVINANPSSPSLSGASICGLGNATLSATSSSPVTWYSVPSGGTPVGTGLSYVTPSIAATTTYYAEAGSAGCSSPRVSVVAIVNSVPAAPVASGNSVCGSGSLILSATGVGQLYWFANASGGAVLDSGSTFTTPGLNNSTTYYVETKVGNCKSQRSAAVASVIPLPTSPSTSNVSICGSGQANLSAFSSEQIYWFTVPSGGTPVSTGPVYTTPTITTVTTYYVEAGNTCRSLRVPVIVSVNSNPAPPATIDGSVCGSGTAVLSANSAFQINWYSIPSGGTPIGTGLTYTTPFISVTTTYYAEAGNTGCPSVRVPVLAVINNLPAAPVSSGNSNCGPGTVSLTATGTGTFYWYASASGGTALDSSSTYTTPVLNSTTNYYVQVSDGKCLSTRTTVVATIAPIPAAPATSDVSRCGPGTVILSASSLEQIYWYNSPTGGSLLGTGASFTTPSISSNTTYYVETGNTCRSIRVPVQALITTAPNPPVLMDTSRCGPGTLVLQAVSSNQVNWYTAPSGGSSIGTGSNFTTPSINATTTYYADAGIGCNSVRVPVTASIIAAPAPPVVSDVTRCGEGIVNLTAISGQQVYWFDSSSGGNLLGTGPSISTPYLTAATTYYVETGDICRSTRVPVQALLGGTQVDNIVEAAICGSGIAVLSASSSLAVDSIVWFDQPGGVSIGEGVNFTTPFISATTPYYVVAYSACTGVPVQVNAIVFPAPSFSIGPDTLILQSGQSLTLDAGSGMNSYLWSTGQNSSSINVVTGGYYSVSITDANGCPSADTVFVEMVTGIFSLPTKSELLVYPNPTYGQVVVTIPQSSAKSFTLKVLSMDGKILINEEVKNSFSKNQLEVIDIKRFAAGVYLLELIGNDYYATVKLVKQ